MENSDAYATNSANVSTDGTQINTLLEDLQGLITGKGFSDPNRPEETNRLKASFLQRLIDIIPNPVFFKDMEGRFQGINLAFETFMGVMKEQVLGHCIHDFAPPELAQLCHAKDLELIKQASNIEYETKLCFPGRPPQDVLISKATFQNEKGEWAGIVGVIMDITERKKAEEALHHSLKLESLGLMAGGIAHDFNNFFQSLQGNLEVAILGLAAGSRERAALDRCMRTLGKASTLSQRMLEFSGHVALNASPVDLCQLVSSQRMSLERTLPPDARLSLRLDPKSPPIWGDAHLLTQVLDSLVANAIDAQPNRIEVRVEYVQQQDQDGTPGFWAEGPPSGPMVCLTVADTGFGICSFVMGRMFDPFFTTKGTGRGLGLSATLGILKSHGAGLQVLSEEGQGSTFRICFAPLGRHETFVSPPPQKNGHSTDIRNVLVVDDDDDLRETVCDILRNVLGFGVLEARDGLEGVEIFRQHSDTISLVILDVTMPRMRGGEAFDAMRCIRPDLPGILCSGYSEEMGTQIAAEHGFITFLKKPYPMKDLQDAIELATGVGLS